MMREQLSLGPTPSGESCQQMGSPEYDSTKARAECRAFINQLGRVFGPPPEGASFRIKSNPHDFGSYLDVNVEYDENVAPSIDYAYKVEANTPEEWDAAARVELGIA